MARFLLVHGSWQGAWCWQQLVPRLEAHGHSVLALDLPGYGTDSARAATTTLDDYIACVVEAVGAYEEAPVLLGHSFGAFISQVAEAIPDRIRCLIFLSAIIPPNGCSMMHSVNQFDPEYLAQIEWAPDRRSVRISPEGAAKFLYPECPPAIFQSVLPRLGVQSVSPYEYLFSLSDANFGRVPRHYIRCLRDRVVPPKLQDEICASHGLKNVHSLDTDHSPFFSAPEEFAALLHTIAQQA
jgi:pimeloyl-ACP methyl ester carboxylesterase